MTLIQIRSVSYEELREVDQFMLVKLNKLIKTVREIYDNYEFAGIYHAVNNFCTLDLSSFYLDFAKDIFYIEAKNNTNAERFKQSFMSHYLHSLNYCRRFFLIQR